jgi:hypothetical protein
LAGGVYSGSSWLRIGTGGGLLWIRWWTCRFWRHVVSYCTKVKSFLYMFMAWLNNRI